MENQERIKQAFDRLVKEGTEILDASEWTGSGFEREFPASEQFYKFRLEVMNLVRRSCGKDSDHYKELIRMSDDKDVSRNSFYFAYWFGVLEAARSDFESGLLFNIRSLITADVLADFIEQSEVLLKAGYHVPAASLAGAVLEDALRKLCEKHNITMPASTKIDRLNADLARAGVYNKLVQKQITALADIRNNADHAHFDQFTKPDVEEMVKWVRRFTADYLQ